MCVRVVVFLFFSVHLQYVGLAQDTLGVYDGNISEQLEVDQATEDFQKLNLNQADLKDLLKLSFMTTLDINCIEDYKKKNGSFLHVMELSQVPGLSPEKVEMLIPFVEVKVKGNSNFGQLPIRQSMSIRWRQNLLNAQWKGDSKWSQVYRYQGTKGNQFKWGGMLTKDAGETWNAPQYLFKSAYAQWMSRNERWNVLCGDYSLQWAQGLIMSGNFVTRPSWQLSSFIQPSVNLRPYTSTIESARKKGVVLKYKDKNHLLILGFNHHWVHGDQDSSSVFNESTNTVFSDSTSKLSWRQSIRRQNFLLYQFQYRHHQWGLGFLSDSIYRGNIQWNLAPTQYSFSWNHQQHQHHFFSEVQWNSWMTNVRIGVLKSLHPKLRMGLLMSRNLFLKGGYTKENRVQWEWQFNDVSSMYFGFAFSDEQRTLQDLPLANQQWFCQLNFIPKRNFIFYYRIQQQTKEALTVESRTFVQSYYNVMLQRYDGNLKFHQDWSVHFRCDFLHDSRYAVRSQYSFLELDFHPLMRPVSVVARYTFYDAPFWDMRLYAQERGVSGTYYIPVLYGKGERFYILTSVCWKGFEFQSKASLVANQGRMGSCHFDFFRINIPMQILEIKMIYSW